MKEVIITPATAPTPNTIAVLVMPEANQTADVMMKPPSPPTVSKTNDFKISVVNTSTNDETILPKKDTSSGSGSPSGCFLSKIPADASAIKAKNRQSIKCILRFLVTIMMPVQLFMINQTRMNYNSNIYYNNDF
mmetsp:Transcript_15595/g.22916  ORF Transcript_15595/g.22916 Transcript_15595/m.22916 type:complete len:134 (-) Transcript_15595:18-419(-)